MPTIVVDASALVPLLLSPSPPKTLLTRLAGSMGAAPEVLDAEFLNVVRKFVLRGDLTATEGASAVRKSQEAPIVRVSHRPLLDRAWELHRTVSGYDALYIALAEEFKIPLITCDKKLAGTSDHTVDIELYPTE